MESTGFAAFLETIFAMGSLAIIAAIVLIAILAILISLLLLCLSFAIIGTKPILRDIRDQQDDIDDRLAETNRLLGKLAGESQPPEPVKAKPRVEPYFERRERKE